LPLLPKIKKSCNCLHYKYTSEYSKSFHIVSLLLFSTKALPLTEEKTHRFTKIIPTFTLKRALEDLRGLGKKKKPLL
jgi:hypothetical protein